MRAENSMEHILGSAPLQLAWLLRETAEYMIPASIIGDTARTTGWASACHGLGVPEAAMYLEGYWGTGLCWTFQEDMATVIRIAI